MSARRAPSGLGRAGRQLWRGVTGDYELSAGELETLRQCCRQADVIARLDEALAETDVVVTGSMGQMRTNPLVGAVSEARRTLDGLLRSLSLPMPDEAEGHRRSPAAAASAQARWRAQRGQVA